MLNNEITPLSLIQLGFSTDDFHLFFLKITTDSNFLVDVRNKKIYTGSNLHGIVNLYLKKWTIENLQTLYFKLYKKDLVLSTYTRLTPMILFYLGFERDNKTLEYTLKNEHSNLLIEINFTKHSSIKFRRLFVAEEEKENKIFTSSASLEDLIYFYFAFTNTDIDENLSDASVYNFLSKNDFVESPNDKDTWFIQLGDFQIVYRHNQRTISLRKEDEIIRSEMSLNIQQDYKRFYQQYTKLKV